MPKQEVLLMSKQDRDELLERLLNETESVANEIRKHSKKQWRTWQKIPYTVLNRDGRDGWSGGEQYRYGYMLLDDGRLSSLKHLGVDLETGDIIDIHGHDVKNTDIISVLVEFDRLDARKILEDILRKTILERPARVSYETWEENKRRRVSLMREFNIKPDRHARKKSLKKSA